MLPLILLHAADPVVAWGYVNTALALYQNFTVLTVGQISVFAGAPICSSAVPAELQAGIRVPCMAPQILPPGNNTFLGG